MAANPENKGHQSKNKNMKNKTVANWLIGSYSLAILGGLMGMSEGATEFVGLVMIAFAIVAVVRLYKLEDK